MEKIKIFIKREVIKNKKKEPNGDYRTEKCNK